MTDTNRPSGELVQPTQSKLPSIPTRVLVTSIALFLGWIGIQMATVRMEYDLKYEDLASPLMHYAGLLSFCLVPVAVLFCAIAKTQPSMHVTLATLAMLMGIAAVNWQIVALPFYLIGIVVIGRRLWKLERESRPCP